MVYYNGFIPVPHHLLLCFANVAEDDGRTISVGHQQQNGKLSESRINTVRMLTFCPRIPFFCFYFVEA